MSSASTPAEPRLPAGLTPPPDGCRIADSLEQTAVQVGGPRCAALSVANLRLDEVLVDGGDVREARLKDARCTDVVVREANLANVVIDGGSLERIEIVRCRMTGITLVETDVRDLVCRECAADLAGASFSHAQFTHSEFVRCRMDDVEGVDGLRGTSMEVEQMLTLAPAFAAALGISQADAGPAAAGGGPQSP